MKTGEPISAPGRLAVMIVPTPDRVVGAEPLIYTQRSAPIECGRPASVRRLGRTRR